MVQKEGKNGLPPYGKPFFRSSGEESAATFAVQKQTINPINAKEYERLFKRDAYRQ